VGGNSGYHTPAPGLSGKTRPTLVNGFRFPIWHIVTHSIRQADQDNLSTISLSPNF